MILITTCRKPAVNTRVFARRLSNLIPDSKYLTRGKKSIHGLIEYARMDGYRRIALITERRGNPLKFEFIQVTRNSWDWSNVLEIKGTWSEQNKVKYNEIKITGRKKFFEQNFLVESGDDANLIAQSKKEGLIFKVDDKELMKIRFK